MYKTISIIIIVLLVLGACSSNNENNNLIDNTDNKKEEIIDNKKDENDETSENDNTDSVIDIKKQFIDVNQSIQENGYYCVPATVQMVLDFNNIYKSQDELAQLMNTSSKTGTEYVDLARVLNTFLFDKETILDNEPGYHIQTFKPGAMTQSDLDVLEKRITLNMETSDFTFIAVNMNALYSNMPVANHMILVVGYTLEADSNTIREFMYIDPYPEVQDEVYGGLKTVTPNELLNAINTGEEPAYVY